MVKTKMQAKKRTVSGNKKGKKPQPTKRVEKEMTVLGGALRALGGLGGGALGSLVGHPTTGASFGTGLGASLSKWLGSGAYAVSKNTLAKGSTPLPMHSNNTSVIIRHREYLTDIVSSGTANTFSAASYYLNPGLSTTFPFLSTIAQQFQEYTIRGLIFEFKSTSADAIASSTNTTLGTVMMATQYNGAEPQFTSKQQMLNESYSTDAKPSESFCHPIECDPKENPYKVQYIRANNVPAGQDIKTYDLGVMSVATAGFQGTNVVCGELWCTYEVELRKPTITGGLNLFGRYAHYRSSLASDTTAFGNGTLTTYADSLSTSSQLGVSVSGGTITLPIGIQGTFCMILYYSTATAISFSQAFSITNGSLQTVGGIDTSAFYTPVSSGGNGLSYILFFNVLSSAVQTTITQSTSPYLNGTPPVDIFIMQIPALLPTY
jgi:hypothetical protein